jgi:hypothetical protein
MVYSCRLVLSFLIKEKDLLIIYQDDGAGVPEEEEKNLPGGMVKTPVWDYSS